MTRFAVLACVLTACLRGVPALTTKNVHGESLVKSTDASGSCSTDRTGVDGACGSFGAARIGFDVQARIDEAMPIELVFPAGDDGTVAAGAPFPVVVVVQGALVTADRYRWLGEHFATRGYVTIIPGHFAELAVFEVDNARIALKSVEREARKNTLLSGIINEDSKAAVLGHSLGGVVATWQWLADTRFLALALLAAYPSAGDDLSQRAGAPVLSIIGAQDGRASPDKALEGLLRFAEPRFFASVEGMTHYDWTDAANTGELKSESEAARPQIDTRKDAFSVIDVWLDAVLRDDATALVRLQSGTFPPGVEVVR